MGLSMREEIEGDSPWVESYSPLNSLTHQSLQRERDYSLVHEYWHELERERNTVESGAVSDLMDGGACAVPCLLFGGCVSAAGQ